MSAISPLDRLRRRYKQIAGQPDPTFNLPIERTAGSDLVAVYKELGFEEFQEIRERWAGLDSDDSLTRSELNAKAEIISKACVDILIRDDDDDEAIAVDGLPGRYLPGMGLGQGPVTYHAAATALELVLSEDPLSAVYRVLASDWEVSRHGNRVSAWEPTVTSPEVDDEIVGESERAASPAR